MRNTTQTLQHQLKPVSDHIHELRSAFFVVIAVMVASSIAAYGFSAQLVRLIQRPLNQTLFYTSPISGFSFVMKLCLTVGAIVTIPVAVNRLISFAKPALPRKLQQNLGWYSIASIFLAGIGVTFAYFVSLPAALQFLTTFNAGADIKALITVDSYFSFVTTYLTGYALLFQMPLLMLFINRVKPLTPQKLLGSMRMVILVSFIVSAVLTPTPDPWNLILMAIPCILLYGLGVVLVLARNTKTKSSSVVSKGANHVRASQREESPPTQHKQNSVPAVLVSCNTSVHPPRTSRPKTFDIVGNKPSPGQRNLGAIQ